MICSREGSQAHTATLPLWVESPMGRYLKKCVWGLFSPCNVDKNLDIVTTPEADVLSAFEQEQDRSKRIRRCWGHHLLVWIAFCLSDFHAWFHDFMSLILKSWVWRYSPMWFRPGDLNAFVGCAISEKVMFRFRCVDLLCLSVWVETFACSKWM